MSTSTFTSGDWRAKHRRWHQHTYSSCSCAVHWAATATHAACFVAAIMCGALIGRNSMSTQRSGACIGTMTPFS